MTEDAKVLEFMSVYKKLKEADEAAIFAGSVNQGAEVRVVEYDLATAQLETNPKPVGFAFRSFIVFDATDTSATISMRLGTRDSYQDAFDITKTTSTFELPYPVNNAFLHWTAQTGKTMTLIYFRSGKMTLNRTSTAVTAGEGSAIGAPVQVTLVAATAAAILPASGSRNTAIAQNNTGADIWVGDSTVTNAGATLGIRYSNGERIIWKNTAALYAYSVAGGVVSTVEET